MAWLQIGTLWLHVLGGILWFGGDVYANLVVTPVLATLPPQQQRRVGHLLRERGERVIFPIALATIALGVVSGTVFGPVRSGEVLFGTLYGVTWLVSFIVAVGVALWDPLVLDRQVERVLEDDRSWVPGEEKGPLVLHRAFGLFLIELSGFLVIFSAMILMRFGL
ncbi:MAG TPA: hypothetical protein VND96_07335 [Candidatus Micrarchaeaceae archaeon]|nr:hypothetical protein [Candidatus Micrarchaeaceae archaeon]